MSNMSKMFQKPKPGNELRMLHGFLATSPNLDATATSAAMARRHLAVCLGRPQRAKIPGAVRVVLQVCSSSPRKRIFKSSQGRILLEHAHVSGMCRTCVHLFEMIHPDLSEHGPGLVDKMNNPNLLIPRELPLPTPGP